jgi:hypothetical protein
VTEALVSWIGSNCYQDDRALWPAYVVLLLTWTDGYGPVVQVLPFRESGGPLNKKKKKKKFHSNSILLETNFILRKLFQFRKISDQISLNISEARVWRFFGRFFIDKLQLD